jgi:hypothetical protein
MVVDCRVFKGIPQRGSTPIQIEIAIEIGNLPEIDFDHDFDFDTELQRVENKNALHELPIEYFPNAE